MPGEMESIIKIEQAEAKAKELVEKAGVTKNQSIDNANAEAKKLIDDAVNKATAEKEAKLKEAVAKFGEEKKRAVEAANKQAMKLRKARIGNRDLESIAEKARGLVLGE